MQLVAAVELGIGTVGEAVTSQSIEKLNALTPWVLVEVVLVPSVTWSSFQLLEDSVDQCHF